MLVSAIQRANQSPFSRGDMKDFAHVHKRGRVWQYQRRVPLAVVRNPVGYETYFKSRPLFRRSLKVVRLIDMVQAASACEREFEELVAKAVGRKADIVIGSNDIFGPTWQGGYVASQARALDRRPPDRTLREVVNSYIEQRQFPPKTASEVRYALKMFEVLNGNLSLDALDDEHFIKFVERLASKTVGGKTEGSVARPVARATVKKQLTFLHSAIEFAIKRRWFTGQNPAKRIDVDAFVVPPNKVVTPDKRRFSVDELNRVFALPMFVAPASQDNLGGAEYWAPVVALYSGMRAGEIGGLMLSEVVTGGPVPHFRVRANANRGTKSGRSRSVPILDALADLGFKEYVERIASTGAERLFPDWKFTANGYANAPLIRAFNRTVVPTALGASFVPGARREVTFHAFRGAFKWMLIKNGVSKDFVDEVVGHRQTKLDAAYLNEWTIDDTYPVVRGCQYPGLTLAAPYSSHRQREAA